MPAVAVTSSSTAAAAFCTEGVPKTSTRPACREIVTVAGGGATGASRSCRSCQGSIVRAVSMDTAPSESDVLSVTSVRPKGSATRHVLRVMRSMVTTVPSYDQPTSMRAPSRSRNAESGPS